MRLLFRTFVILSTIQLASCGFYGFKGITIPANVNTYLVEDFSLIDPKSPVELNQTFAESLREKIRNESKLVKNEQTPDISFSGSIARYEVKFIAPAEGSSASLNRLEITIKVNFEDFLNDKNSWSKPYSAFEDFDSNADFESLVDGMTENIIVDIVERVFNDAFTNW